MKLPIGFPPKNYRTGQLVSLCPTRSEDLERAWKRRCE
jgi:hypothetical protein